MTTLREAVQQALEALDAGAPSSPGSILHDWFRAALAQQAEPLNLADPAVQKRLASQWGYVPAAAQAEPVEPVAVVATQSDVWRGYNGQWAPGEPIKTVQMLRDLPMGTLLYTAPPQRKPLTEEEIKTAFHAARNAKLGASQDNSRHRLSVIEIARAVEQASWEKNHGQA